MITASSVAFAEDRTRRLGRGFSKRNLEQMRLFYLTWRIPQTASAESMIAAFPLSWSHYVRLLSVRSDEGRRFYEAEALRGGPNPHGASSLMHFRQ
jgi:hypothetical protein